MNILFISRRFWPEIGGVEKHTLEVAKRLVKEGHEVVVLAELPSSFTKQSLDLSAKDMGEKDGIKIIKIKVGKDNWFKKFRVWKELWGQKETLKKADIIHCHDVFFWYLPFRFIYPYKPVYVTFHGYEGNKIPGEKAIFSHRLAEICCKGSISIGSFYKKWYGTNSQVINYGATNIKKNLKVNKPGKIKKILFAGRLEEETGIMEYLQALTLLPKSFKYTIDILGDGNLKKNAEDYCKKNKINAKFHGFIENVSKFTQDSDLVFVSRYLGIIETLALKKPVFALYNNKIKRDYLKMTPFKNYIFIEKNAEEVARDLMKKDYKQMVEKGYKWAIKQTWEKMVKDYLTLWKISS